MTDNEFQNLADPSSPDRTSCPNCECAYMNTDGKLVWAECSETHKYVCEYKGNIALQYGLNLEPNYNFSEGVLKMVEKEYF